MDKKNLVELFKYGICGGITTVINLALFYVMSEAGLYYLIANMIGYYIAVVVNYFLNYFFVFDQNNKEKLIIILKKLWDFIVLRTASLLADTALFFVLVSVLGFHKYISRICLSIVIILINFIWSKRKIFV